VLYRPPRGNRRLNGPRIQIQSRRVVDIRIQSRRVVDIRIQSRRVVDIPIQSRRVVGRSCTANHLTPVRPHRFVL
jgi:hypothetical protein